MKKEKVWDFLSISCFFLLYSFGAAINGLHSVVTVGIFISALFLTGGKISKKSLFPCIWVSIYMIYAMLVGKLTGYTNRSTNVSAIEDIVMVAGLSLYITDTERLKRLVIDFAYAALGFAAIVFFTSPVSSWGTLAFQGITGRQRNTTAFIVGVAVVIFVYLYAKSKEKKYGVFALFCALVTVLTGSRKGIIQLLIPVFVYLISQKNIKKSLRALFFISLIGCVGLIFVLNNQTIMSIYGGRFMEMFSLIGGNETSDTSIQYRSLLAEVGRNSFLQKPIFGWGLGASWKLSQNLVGVYFHNNYIEILACSGVVGFILYYYPIIIAGYRAFRRRNYSEFDMLILSITLVYLILSYGQVTVYYCHFYQIIFFIIKYYSLLSSK